jgi:hypothetical protein
MLGLALIIIGASLMLLRSFQTVDVDGYNLSLPTLYADEVRIHFAKDSPKYIIDAFGKAISDWDRAVREFNYMKEMECRINMLFSRCTACLKEPRLPRILVAGDASYNVIVEFVDSMPERGIIAYTEPYINGSMLARIVVWSGVPEHRAYQVAVHEIARLYGVDIPGVYRTLFGAVPAGSDTSKLNPSMDQFMNGPPDPMKPTTLDLYIAYEGLKNPGVGRVHAQRVIFRAYDEPDFTIPALASPALIVSGLYILPRRWKHAKHTG